MRFIYPLFLLFGSLIPAGAQPGIAIPALGFVFDASLGGIRPIRGIVGAAILGSPLNSGSALESAAISPGQDFALAVSAEDHGVRIVRFQDDGPRDVRSASVLPLPSGMSSPDRMVFSPSGSAAVLYRQDSSRMQILTGLPDTPVVRDLSIAGLNSPAALAINDDGNLALVAGQDSDPSWMVGPDGNFIPLALPGSTMAVAFRRGSHDLLSVTRAGDLYLARDVGTVPAFLRIYAGGATASEPVAVQFSFDGAISYMIGANGTIIAVELATGSIQTISCGCKPAALEPLRPGTMFRLTAVSSLPLMLFDASAGDLHIWFVPPDPAPAKSPESNQ
jgi:hypothetical protein